MTDRDPTPDSPPATDDDSRSDIQQAVEARKDDVERGAGGSGHSALEPTGIPDGVGGTGGVVKNQDMAAQ